MEIFRIKEINIFYNERNERLKQTKLFPERLSFNFVRLGVRCYKNGLH